MAAQIAALSIVLNGLALFVIVSLARELDQARWRLLLADRELERAWRAEFEANRARTAPAGKDGGR